MRNFLFFGCVVLFLSGCETPQPVTKTGPERAALQFDFEGVRLGDRPSALRRFEKVTVVPTALTREAGVAIRDIPDPNPYISLARAYFFRDRLYRLELRYFDGGMVQTLSRAGGWAYLRDYMIKRFGQPSRSGAGVPVVSDQPGMNPQYAKANLQWDFPKVGRQINYFAMADAKGGVALVTFTDTGLLAEQKKAARGDVVIYAPEGTSSISERRPGF